MKRLRLLIWALVTACGFCARLAPGQVATNAAPKELPIDLPTVLRLVEARSLDIQIARAKVAEAQAAQESANLQFFPWIAPGVTYRRHDNMLQDVTGNVIEVHKQAYAPGLQLAAAVDLGDAIYQSLAARRIVTAARSALDAQHEVSAFLAVTGYFELLKAGAEVEVARDAQRIAQNYYGQITQALAAGLAFKGEELRVKSLTDRATLAVEQAVEQRRLASARLVEALHLDGGTELAANQHELLPIALVETNAALESLVQEALANRPELMRSKALVAAASAAKSGVTVGPLIPTVGATAFAGGLGGSRDGGPDVFGSSYDFAVGLSWRIGPGGLFDSGRIGTAKARLNENLLADQKLRDQVQREVVESQVRCQSLAAQLETALRIIATATQAEQVAEQRKQFGVSQVLEDIDTQQELTRARSEYANLVAEFDKAQYALRRALGQRLSAAR